MFYIKLMKYQTDDRNQIYPPILRTEFLCLVLRSSDIPSLDRKICCTCSRPSENIQNGDITVVKDRSHSDRFFQEDSLRTVGTRGLSACRGCKEAGLVVSLRLTVKKKTADEAVNNPSSRYGLGNLLVGFDEDEDKNVRNRLDGDRGIM